MSDVARAKTIAAALAARSALDALLIELSQEQEPAAPTAPPAPPEPPASCQHENRRDVRTFGMAEAWDCTDCGFQYRR